MEESRLSTVDLVDQLEEIFLEGGRIPFSGNRLVNEQDAIDVLDEIRESLPSEIIKAAQIIQAGDKHINQAKLYSEEIINKAKLQRDKLVDTIGVKKEAERQINKLQEYSQKQAEKIIEEAKQKAKLIEKDIKLKMVDLEKSYNNRKAKLDQDILKRTRKAEIEEQQLRHNLNKRLENNNAKAIEQLELIKEQSINLKKEALKNAENINNEAKSFRENTQRQCEVLILQAKKEASNYQEGAHQYADDTLKELERRLKEINHVVIAGRKELNRIQLETAKRTSNDKTRSNKRRSS